MKVNCGITYKADFKIVMDLLNVYLRLCLLLVTQPNTADKANLK